MARVVDQVKFAWFGQQAAHGARVGSKWKAGIGGSFPELHGRAHRGQAVGLQGEPVTRSRAIKLPGRYSTARNPVIAGAPCSA